MPLKFLLHLSGISFRLLIFFGDKKTVGKKEMSKLGGGEKALGRDSHNKESKQ